MSEQQKGLEEITLKEKIPVVFGIDSSYLLQAFVVMASILSNSCDQYHFFILTKDDIDVHADELSKKLWKCYPNFSLTIRKIGVALFSDAKVRNSHLSEAAFYRLLIPELITEYDKCIYLDSDLLVNGDMRELFEIDLDDNYLGGVKDCHLISFHETKHQRHLGISSLKSYINSGVLLMNLAKMRNDDLVASFLLQAKKENLYEDQDVLNLCCYNSIKVLPIKYNLFHFYQGDSIKELFDLPYEKEEFAFDWENPFILHMGDEFKPWIGRKYKGAKEWWGIAEIYKGSGEYQRCNEKCRMGYGENEEIEKIIELCKKKKRVILWGYSKQGMDVCNVLIKKGISIYSFCDNDERQQGKTYRGIPVFNVKEVLKFLPDVLWIITCKRAYKQVYKQLIELGVEQESIVHFIYNSRRKEYYLALEKCYYEEEIKTIALCENDQNQMTEEQYLEYIEQLIQEEDTHKADYRYLYHKYRFDLWLKC